MLGRFWRRTTLLVKDKVEAMPQSYAIRDYYRIVDVQAGSHICFLLDATLEIQNKAAIIVPQAGLTFIAHIGIETMHARVLGVYESNQI